MSQTDFCSAWTSSSSEQMSAIGPKQTWPSAPHMSAFGGKADMTIGTCPLSWSLSGVKQTSLVAAHMSAYDPKRTRQQRPASTIYRILKSIRSVREEKNHGGHMDPGYSRFPTVTAVDANKRSNALDLIFHTRINGQAATLRITLTFAQWENLKFLVEAPQPAAR